MNDKSNLQSQNHAIIPILLNNQHITLAINELYTHLFLIHKS